MARTQVERGLNKLLRAVDLKLVHLGRSDEGRRQKLIFFHVPKCGGQSVNDAFSSALGLDTLADQRAQFRFAAAAVERNARALGISVAEQNRILLRYAIELRNSRFISGHLMYDSVSLQGFEDDWALVTTLREPTSHMLSGYYYSRYKADPELHGTDLELEAWLEGPAARQTGLTFVRYFDGDPVEADTLAEESNGSERLERAIERAIANLERFAVVGQVSDMKGFEDAIHENLGLRVQVERLNRSPAGTYPKFAETSPDVQRKITELCAPNERVFRHFFPTR